MTKPVTLTIYSMTSARCQAWISSIEYAALRKGWKIGGNELNSKSHSTVIFQDLPDSEDIPLAKPYFLLFEPSGNGPGDCEKKDTKDLSEVCKTPSLIALNQAEGVLDASSDALDIHGIGIVAFGTNCDGVYVDMSLNSEFTPQKNTHHQDVLSANSAHWPADFFSTSNVEHPIRQLERNEWISLQGRQRVLVFGPYIALPPGYWRATLTIAVDTEGLKIPLNFQWGSASASIGCVQTLTVDGTYEVALEAALTDAQPTEFRVFPLNAMFGGRIMVISCDVELVP